LIVYFLLIYLLIYFQNRFQCSPTVQSLLSGATFTGDKSTPPSVCRSCCSTNNCNRRWVTTKKFKDV